MPALFLVVFVSSADCNLLTKNDVSNILESDICFFKKKWAIPGLFYHLFLVFSNKHYNFYKNICEKMSIRLRDLNPQPLELESLPI